MSARASAPSFLSVPRGLLQARTKPVAFRGDARSGQRKIPMINGIIGDHRPSTRCLWAAIWFMILGPSTVLGQSPVDLHTSKPASTPSLPKPAAPLVPKPATAPLPKPATTPPAAMPDSSVEDRLRRMEEAYRRIDEANKKIQGQYDGLLKKYDELKSQLKSDRGVEPGRTTSATTRPASRVRAVEYQEPPSREVSEGMGAQGMAGRTAPGVPSGIGAEGLEARGVFREGGGLPPTTAMGVGPPSAPAGASRRSAQGIGAQGDSGTRLSARVLIARRREGAAASRQGRVRRGTGAFITR